MKRRGAGTASRKRSRGGLKRGRGDRGGEQGGGADLGGATAGEDNRGGTSPAPTNRVEGPAGRWFEPAMSQPSERFIEDMKPKMLTSSAIETYQRCPRQYMYGTIYGFRGEDTTYRLFWKATQGTLEALTNKLEAPKQAEAFPPQHDTQELHTPS